MAMQAEAVMAAVARRLEQDPQHVLLTLRLLADPDAVAAPSDTDTVRLARRVNVARLAERRETFRAQALSTAEVRKFLGGVTRQAVGARVAHGGLMSLEIAGTSYFPDWQFGPDGPLPGLPAVVDALAGDGRSALAADALMRTPLPEEDGRSPAQLLAEGDIELVLHYVTAAGADF